MNPHKVTQDFEHELCAYTGAPYAVAVNSCTMALLLAVAWSIKKMNRSGFEMQVEPRPAIEIPKRTYVGVPMSIIHAGGRPTFRDEEWRGTYQLKPLPVWDSARYFTSGLYKGKHQMLVGRDPSRTVTQINLDRDCAGHMLCVSFHAAKTLGIEQGGAILHDNEEADAWLRRARFDGRTEGVAPNVDTFPQLGWHCYPNPSMSAQGLLKLHSLPRHNRPLPNDDYPDLSTLEIFR